MPKLVDIPEYNIYRSMKTRCYNSNCKSYKNYGGRGIKICDKWIRSFEEFYKDMGPRPTPEHSLDRIDHNGDYEPSNCRWTTWDIQLVNRRPRERRYKYKGVWINSKTNTNSWRATISINGSYLYLGNFRTPEEAANMYDQFAIQIYGDDIKLNFEYI